MNNEIVSYQFIVKENYYVFTVCIYLKHDSVTGYSTNNKRQLRNKTVKNCV